LSRPPTTARIDKTLRVAYLLESARRHWRPAGRRGSPLSGPDLGRGWHGSGGGARTSSSSVTAATGRCISVLTGPARTCC